MRLIYAETGQRYTKSMRLPLVAADSPILHQAAHKVGSPDQVRALVDNLLETMVAEGGVGLAAPQVGQRLRVFVTGVDGQNAAWINPVIMHTSAELVPWEEGCLSLPRMVGPVVRPKAVKVQATRPDGKMVTVTADGLLARVLQHETDHLDGILFPERMDDLSKLRRISEAEWDSRFDSQNQQPITAE